MVVCPDSHWSLWITHWGACAHVRVRSMNTQPKLFYYSLEPDVPLIGGWRSDEEERQPNNELHCIRAAPLYCCYTHSTVQFATLSLFFCFCNSTMPLISLPDLSVFPLFCFPAYSLHVLPSVCFCLPYPPLLLMWRQMLWAPRRRVSLK